MKDVYLLITRENKSSLHDLENFIWYHDYSDNDKYLYQGDIGILVSKNHRFHFRYHENVIFDKHLEFKDKEFIFPPPDENEFRSISQDEIFHEFMKYVHSDE